MFRGAIKRLYCIIFWSLGKGKPCDIFTKTLFSASSYYSIIQKKNKIFKNCIQLLRELLLKYVYIVYNYCICVRFLL